MGLFIGITLAEERKKQKLSLQKVSADTKISIKYLKALEEEDLNVFPARVYVRGFLAMYCRYLQLNAEEILSVYEQQYGRSSEQQTRNSPLAADRFWARPSFIIIGLSITVIFILILVLVVRAQ